MRIGFFGGAFDPLHKEHIEIIREVPEELGLDRLVLVPTYSSPHKKSTATEYRFRRKMLEPYLSDRVIVSDFENESKKPFNCTAETLPALKALYPADEYFFIIGSDSMLAFSTWIRPKDIAREATLAVVCRDGFLAGLDEAIARAKKEYSAKIVVLTHTGRAVSSRELRARLDLGMPAGDFLDGNTQKIIAEHDLYSQKRELVERVKAAQPDRYPHMFSTVIAAMRLSATLDFEKVFTAGLLHDVGKNVSGVDGVPEDSVGTKVEHQFASALIAERDYGVTDAEVLDAIRYHTTAKPDMSPLEKLIYLADMIEDTRDFEGVATLREIAYADPDKGFLAALEYTYRLLKTRNKPIYPLTLEAVGYYLKKENI